MENGGDENQCCYFHPGKAIIGVCALCLKERLLILASKQGQAQPLSSDGVRSHRGLYRKPAISIPRVFALSSFLHRLEFRHRKSDASEWEASSSSNDESFISIKFEDNGQASWDRGERAAVVAEGVKGGGGGGAAGKSMVEHGKLRSPTLRWRKRIGHLFHLARWKRSSGNMEAGSKVRKGWMRALTKRRSNME